MQSKEAFIFQNMFLSDIQYLILLTRVWSIMAMAMVADQSSVWLSLAQQLEEVSLQFFI